MDEAIYISHSANIYSKGMSLITQTPAMSKVVGQTRLRNSNISTGSREENSESKPVKLPLNKDLLSRLARTEILDESMHINSICLLHTEKLNICGIFLCPFKC